MNNEAKYESIINGIDEVIYEKTDIDSCNISIEISLEIVEFMQKSLENLRDYIINHPFESKDEEIHFFKYVKPEVLGRLLYFTDIYNVEMRMPNGSNDVLKKYFEDRLYWLLNHVRKGLFCVFYPRQETIKKSYNTLIL